MGDRELLGGESKGIKPDQVPAAVNASFGMALAKGDQITEPNVIGAPATVAKPLFGAHVAEAIRVLKGTPKP